MTQFPLFESICFQENEFPLLNYHLERMHRTCRFLFSSSFQKEKELLTTLQGIHSNTKMKVRVEYDEKHFKVSSSIYHPKNILAVSLLLKEDIIYPYKTTNRDVFLQYQQEHKEVVFVKNGCLTDTTFSNIALWNGEEWHTPESPLLHGTRRQCLLENKKIKERKITLSEMERYHTLSFINGMLDLGELVFPVRDIKK